jgi:hypothetical protein
MSEYTVAQYEALRITAWSWARTAQRWQRIAIGSWVVTLGLIVAWWL